MAANPILISESDIRRLRGVLGGAKASSIRDLTHLHDLRMELDRAVVLDSEELPPDVIRMHSQVQVLDLSSGERRDYELVFPPDADPAANRISVLAPLGTALLGYREGDEFEWVMPGGARRLRVERVSSSPPTHRSQSLAVPVLPPLQ